jgi:hypothetical protein
MESGQCRGSGTDFQATGISGYRLQTMNLGYRRNEGSPYLSFVSLQGFTVHIHRLQNLPSTLRIFVLVQHLSTYLGSTSDLLCCHSKAQYKTQSGSFDSI